MMCVLCSVVLGESAGLHNLTTALLKGVQAYLDFGNLRPGWGQLWDDHKRAKGHVQLLPALPQSETQKGASLHHLVCSTGCAVPGIRLHNEHQNNLQEGLQRGPVSFPILEGKVTLPRLDWKTPAPLLEDLSAQALSACLPSHANGRKERS